jgi:hypothetical protein
MLLAVFKPKVAKMHLEVNYNFETLQLMDLKKSK